MGSWYGWGKLGKICKKKEIISKESLTERKEAARRVIPKKKRMRGVIGRGLLCGENPGKRKHRKTEFKYRKGGKDPEGQSINKGRCSGER